MTTLSTSAIVRENVNHDLINIILVDDNPDSLYLQEKMLWHSRRNIFKATTIHEALAIALENPIALIVIDVQAEQDCGIGLSALLRNNPKTKDIAIIFITSEIPDEKFVVQEYDNGIVDYICKPLEYKFI